MIHRRVLLLAAQADEHQGTEGKEAVAQADAKIDWSIAQDGNIAPSLPYGLLPTRAAGQLNQQAKTAV